MLATTAVRNVPIIYLSKILVNSLVHTGLLLISNQVAMSNHRADRVGLTVGNAVSLVKADRGVFP